MGTDNPFGNAVGMFNRCAKSIRFDDVSDGLSNTVMVGETLPSHWCWNGVFCPNHPVSSMSIPLNNMYSDMTLDGGYDPNGGYTWAKSTGFKSLHPGGANMLMADGSVQFFFETISHQVYCALGMRAGGEVVHSP